MGGSSRVETHARKVGVTPVFTFIIYFTLIDMSNSTLNIIKIGGNVIDDDIQLDVFLEKFAAIPGKKILVHGGGKIATRVAEGLGIEAKWWKAVESPMRKCWMWSPWCTLA